MWATMWAVIEGRFDEARGAGRRPAGRAARRRPLAGAARERGPDLRPTAVARRARRHAARDRSQPPTRAYRLNSWALLAWLEAGSGHVAGHGRCSTGSTRRSSRRRTAATCGGPRSSGPRPPPPPWPPGMGAGGPRGAAPLRRPQRRDGLRIVPRCGGPPPGHARRGAGPQRRRRRRTGGGPRAAPGPRRPSLRGPVRPLAGQRAGRARRIRRRRPRPVAARREPWRSTRSSACHRSRPLIPSSEAEARATAQPGTNGRAPPGTPTCRG